jgi:hypothetical protein
MKTICLINQPLNKSLSVLLGVIFIMGPKIKHITKKDQEKIKYLSQRLMHSITQIHKKTGISYQKIRYFVNYDFDYDKAIEAYLSDNRKNHETKKI